MANEHVFRQSLIITGSVTSSVGFSGDGSGLTGITAVAEWDGSRNGDASITGSFVVSGSGVNVDFTNTTGVSGSFSGSFEGDGSGLTGISTSLPAGVVSGSEQISYTGITDIPSGIVSSSAQFNSLTDPFSGSFTGSFTGNGSGLTDLSLPAGTVSSSAQISYTGIADIPANIISSSLQFDSITKYPFTGSFTGSFTGDGSGLTGITATATGGIFQTGSNTGAIKTNDTSYTSIASGQYSFAGGGRYVTASADYTTVLGGINTQATATYATAIGGQTSIAGAIGATAVGGVGSIATGSYSVALGGATSCAEGIYSAVLGGCRNTAFGEGSGVVAGKLNTINDVENSAVVGGLNNTVANSGAVILGGSCQTTTRDSEVLVTTLTVSGSGTGLADAKLVGAVVLANRTATPSAAPVGTLMVSGSNLYFNGSGGWVQIN